MSLEERPATALQANPEMTRPFPLTRLGNGTRFMVEASQDECRRLAVRMGVPAIHALTCRFDLRPGESGTIDATGRLRARVRQICVVTIDPFDAEIAEDFTLRFVPEGKESLELDLEADDEVPYSGGLLDLGEAASEQLALALDPFPRKPGAELEAEISEASSSPFAALAKLRPPT
jgi:hypothetical protein